MIILFIGKYHYFENMPVMLLAGFLKKHGHECHYLDLKFERNYLRKVKQIKPDIIAYSLVTGLQDLYLKINKELKEVHAFFALFGGPHCTVYPEFIMEEGVDAICRGDGELPMLELAERMKKQESIINIKNLWVKQNNHIYRNDLRELVPNLDEICIPNRKIFDKYPQYRHLRSRSTVASRGCPFRCAYCYNNIIMKIFSNKGKYVRMRSVGNLIHELREIKEQYKPRIIKFLDDTFILNKTWGLDFCQQYAQHIDLPFIACIRSDIMDEELIIGLKKAGCFAVNFGIECGSEEYRKNILKRHITNEQLKTISNLFRKHKIKVIGLNIVGLPGETIEDCIDTIKFNCECKVSYAHAFMFSPLPDTELSEYAIKNNFFNGNFSLIGYNFMYNKSVLKSNDRRKMKRLQYLFSLIVAYPFLLTFVKLLMYLPLTKVYQSLYFLHRAYNHLFISKQTDWEDIFLVDHFFRKKL